MNGLWFTAALVVLVSALYVYQYLKKTFTFWEVRGVPYIKPNFFFGNAAPLFFRRVPLSLFPNNFYNALGIQKFVGLYTITKPQLLVNDPELIKQMLIKDFVYFQNRGVKINIEDEPLGQHLVLLNGEQWKNLRIKLTPTFTTGKMKMMFPLLETCAKELSDVMLDFSRKTADVEIKELVSRYTMDAIGTCAFGLEIHSLTNPDTQFRIMSKKAFKFRIGTFLRIWFPNMPSFFVRLLRLKFVQDDVSDFFISVVRDMVQYRKENKVTGNDFLDLLISLKDSFNSAELEKTREEVTILGQMKLQGHDKNVKPVEMTINVMAAQCFLFLLAGFDTSATTLSFLLYEIAQNTDIQSRLREEIDKVLNKYDQKLTYQCLQELTYLDMVVSETLRKYPPTTTLIRVCHQDYKIPETDVVIPEGVQVVIPVFAIHYDERYYPNAKEFNPDNFTEEAKASRSSYAYLPFGNGPRMCIAERFAKMQMKVGLVHLIKDYEFHPSPKMKPPMEFDPSTSQLTVKGGVWVRCTERKGRDL